MGLLRENLLVYLNDAENNVLQIPVVGEIHGEYRAAPAGLFFGNPAYGERVVRSCRLGPLHEGDKVEIIGSDAFKGWLEVAVEPDGNAATLEVAYQGVFPSDGTDDTLILRIHPHMEGAERLLQVPILAERDVYSATSHVFMGDRASDFSFADSTGKITRLAELKSKVVLLNLFAIWCRPCHTELSRIERELVARFPADAFAPICIGVGHRVEELNVFQEEQKLHLLMIPDPEKTIYDRFEARVGVPRNYVIDREGTIIYASSGYSERKFSRLVSVIEQAIGVASHVSNP